MKGILAFLALGLVSIFFLTDFLTEIDDDSKSLESSMSKQERERAQFYRVDYSGDTVLDLSGVSLQKAKETWNDSLVKVEILEHFPNFDIIKESIGNELAASEFKVLLLEEVNSIQADLFSGVITTEQAKKRITSF